MMGLIMALAAGVAPFVLNDDSVTDICGHALEAVAHGPFNPMVERYVGRMEIRMDQLKLRESQKPLVRDLCQVYLLGAGKAIEIARKKQVTKD